MCILLKKFTKRRKKYFEIFKTNIAYNVSDAIHLLKTHLNYNFVETVELHIGLNIDLKNINHRIKTLLTFPYNFLAEKRVAAFVEDQDEILALNSGASIAGLSNIMKQIQQQQFNFDVLVTTAKLMPYLIKYGRILGSKNLMPSSKNGTITENVINNITKFKQSNLLLKSDKTGNLHFGFGKITFLEQELYTNYAYSIQSILNLKPIDITTNFFKNIYVCSTMSPSLKITLTS